MKLKKAIDEKLKSSYSMNRFAKEAGLSRTYVEWIQIGMRSPSIEVIEKMCAVIGIDPLEIDEYRQRVSERAVKEDAGIAEEVLKLVLKKGEATRRKPKAI